MFLFSFFFICCKQEGRSSFFFGGAEGFSWNLPREDIFILSLKTLNEELRGICLSHLEKPPRGRDRHDPEIDPQRGFSENRRVGRSGEKIGFCIATSFLGGNKLGFRALGAYLTIYFGRGREEGRVRKIETARRGKPVETDYRST